MSRLLSVDALRIDLIRGKKRLNVVDGLSFELHDAEVLALIGESGCGKSVSCMALTRLTPPNVMAISGTVRLADAGGSETDLLQLSESALRRIRGKQIAYIFQEPGVCLNPVMRVGDQIEEVIALHDAGCTDRFGRICELLGEVGIPEPAARARCYPHELSGGMQQRVMIAMALAARPRILIADEPTTALDVTVQAQILKLLRMLCQKYAMGMILITHNFGLVGELADRVLVMYAGQAVESAAKTDLMAEAYHPYTAALLRAVPVLHALPGALPAIPGQVPAPGDFPSGCRFAPRCPRRTVQCDTQTPERVLCATNPTRSVACFQIGGR